MLYAFGAYRMAKAAISWTSDCVQSCQGQRVNNGGVGLICYRRADPTAIWVTVYSVTKDPIRLFKNHVIQ